MTSSELERYFHEHIPLSAAMAVEVVSVQPERIVLAAPLAPNINHRETVFGGSASAVAILSAWALVQTRLVNAGLACSLVIQRNTMHYDAPMSGAFTASSSLEQPEVWQKFMNVLARRGRARVSVLSVLECDGITAAHFQGDFVALSNV